MAVTPGNLAMGPGALYVSVAAFSPTAALEPFDTQVNSTPASSAWTDVGGTLGGISISITNAWKELEVDQIVEIPERRRTKHEVQFKTQLAEVTFANLTLAMNGGTTASGTGYESYDHDANNQTPTYKALIFDGVHGGGFRRRVFGRKVLSMENIDYNSAKEDQLVYPVTFGTHYVSSSVKSWRMVSATA